MAKEIKKAKKALSPAEVAARKQKNEAYRAERLEKAKARYAKNPTEYIVFAKNRNSLSKVMNKAMSWAEYCSLKQTTCSQYWAMQAQKPERVLKVKVMTQEQVDVKKAKLAAMVARIEAQKAQLAEAMKLLGK